MLGIDYAFFPHPPVDAMKAAGVGFVCRYISSNQANDGNGKNLLPGEARAILSAGLKLVVVVEEGATRMLGGHDAGLADARHADAVVKAIGMPGVPVYFAADWDAAPGQQAQINAYLDGAASVIPRVGIYGGYWPLSRALNAGKASFGWQTIAWSGGFWDSRAVLRQGLGIRVGGIGVDVDHTAHYATDHDFGQWPRPGSAPVPPPRTPQIRVADGTKSLREAANREGTTVLRSLWLMHHEAANLKVGHLGPLQKAYVVAGDFNAPMPQGMRYGVG